MLFLSEKMILLKKLPLNVVISPFLHLPLFLFLFLFEARRIYIRIYIYKKPLSLSYNDLFGAKNIISFKQIPHFRISYLRLENLNFIIEIYIKKIITSANNLKTILRRLQPQIINTSLLQLHFSEIKSIFNSNNIRCKKI